MSVDAVFPIMVGEVRDRETAFRGGNKMMKNATVESMVVEDSKEPEKPIDREKVCGSG